MSIGTYDELKAAIASWIKRTDKAATIPDYIAMAEAKLNRLLEARQTEVETTLTVSEGTSVPLPTDFVSPMDLWWIDQTGRRVPLRFVTAHQLVSDPIAAYPYQWSITTGNIEFGRPPLGSNTFILRYIQRFALSDTSPTNWLLTLHPDAYLAASLAEAFMDLFDEKRAEFWEARMATKVAEVQDLADRAKSRATLSTAIIAGRCSGGSFGDGYVSPRLPTAYDYAAEITD